MENRDKRINFGKIFLVLFMIVSIIGLSLAVFNRNYLGTKNQTLSTATLVLNLDESASDGISLLNTVPVTDTTGLSYKPYTFTVKNNGSIPANYSLKIVDNTDKYTSDNCSTKKLSWTNIKYNLAKKNADTNTYTNLLSTDSGLIDSGTLVVGETNSYELRLWIKEDATNEIMGQHFHGLIQLDANQ